MLSARLSAHELLIQLLLSSHGQPMGDLFLKTVGNLLETCVTRAHWR